MTNILLIIGALIGAAGSLPYILAIMRGKARPQLVTWFVWTVLAGIMTISAYSEGQRASMMLSLTAVVSCGIIVVLGWRQGRLQLNKTDIICLAGAAAGIGSLFVLHDAFMALAVSIAVDIVAFIPTLIHGWIRPSEESLACFVCTVVAAGITLGVALYVHANIVGLMYPTYAVAFNGIMVGILVIGRTTPGSRYQYETDEIATETATL